MRFYHYTKARYALDTLRTGHLKVATLKNLNDPFELFSLTFRTKEERRIQRKLKDYLESKVGLLCLSKSGREPVMWSHYADCHRGIVLAFDASPEDIHEVTYRKTRKPHALDLTRAAGAQLEPLLFETLTTKSSSWSYEQEWRRLIFEKDWISKQLPVDDGSGVVNISFYDFRKDMKLVDVILGPDCTTPVKEVEAALTAGGFSANVFKARRAFRTFESVRDHKI
jgi:hypothetical protein